jgi:flagellar hook-associated protein 2
MKIQGKGSFPVPPPVQGGGVDMGMVDKIMESGRAAVEASSSKREALVSEKNNYSAISSVLGELGSHLDGLKVPAKFQRMKVESSHPDVIGAELLEGAKNLKPGQFSFEVSQLAGAAKYLEQGFSDINDSAVGFGFMAIERGEGLPDLDVTIDPGATLKDVAEKINSVGGGVQASIVNTGIGDEPFKLLVRSSESGVAAKIKIDPDTTFLNFKELKKAQDLAIKFEDVDVARPANSFSDLIDGVKLTAKRAMPGTQVQLNISQDIDATSVGVKDFVEKYNKVFSSLSGQLVPKDGERSVAAGTASTVRQAMRTLQAEVSGGKLSAGSGGLSLADVGVTTNAKSGLLEVNEEKLKKALATNYDGVQKIFASEGESKGLAEKLGDAIKGLQDRQSGVLTLRQKTMDEQIKRQDQVIERQQRALDEKQQRLQKTFSDLNSKVEMMNSQQQAMTARFAG